MKTAGLRTIFMVLLFVGLQAAIVFAEPFDDALSAYNRGDYTTALQIWRSLADQGHADAQFNLGVMYDDGQGVAQDYVQAHMWFSLAASRFSAAEKNNRDSAISNRDRLALKMTPEQIAEAQKLAREWKHR